MSIDSVLRAEVAALLGERPSTPGPKPKPITPLMQALAANDVQPSVFTTTWNMLTGTCLDLKNVSGNHPEDFSDFTASLSGLNGNQIREKDDEGTLTKACEQPLSLEITGTGGDNSNADSVGPPSLTDSTHGLKMDDASETLERPSKANHRSTSQTSTRSRAPSNHSSKVFMQSSGLIKKPSEGLNGILQPSPPSSTVGSTHRTAPPVVKGPRCAKDYLLMVLDSEQLDRKKHEIPRETYKYEDENKNLREKPPAETPVLRDAPVSPISKTFLDSVNHQIQQIKFHQAKERVMFGSRGEPGCVPLHGSIVKQGQLNKPHENLEVGTGKVRTTIIDARNKIKVESEMQTEANSIESSGIITPKNWESSSKMDSQLSVMAVRPRRSSSRASEVFCKKSFYPLEVEVSSVDDSGFTHGSRVRPLNQQHISIFSKFMNFSNAFGATKYGLQAAWNTAEEIFYGYVLPPEVVEESTLTQRDMEETEDHVSVSMLRLMGVPMEIRHAIYREVLGELQAVHDFSVGTVHMLTNVIDWLCTGKHEGTKDLVAKTRILATTLTEVDPDSESWKQFERDLCIFTNAVVDTVGTAARTVSRQCNESCESLLTKLSDYRTAQMSHGQISASSIDTIERPSAGSLEQGASRAETSESIERDYDHSVNPAVISPMVTESEFELPLSARTESTTSQVSSNGCPSRGRRSRIPVFVNASPSRGLPPACPSKSDRDFSLNVLRTALNNTESRQSLNIDESARNATLCRETRAFRRSSKEKISKRLAMETSTKTGGTIPRVHANNKFDPREQYLSPADAKLLAECKNLVGTNKAATSWATAGTSRTAIQHARGHTEPSSISVTEDPSTMMGSIPLFPTEVSDIASVIASVASSVTSALLGPTGEETDNRLYSSIPANAETYADGPSVESSSPTLLETIQEAAMTASRAIFGLSDSVADSIGSPNRRARSNNRFTISPEVLGQQGAPVSSSGQSVLQQYELPYPSNEFAPSQAGSKIAGATSRDPAWELFDYIKQGEANRQQEELSKRSSEAGITAETAPVELKTESSVTARLSKAALTGLFNTFKDSIPAPLVTIKPSTEAVKTPFLKRSESRANYRTASGHSYLVNPVRSSTHSLGRRLQSPSSPIVRVPQCSEVELSRLEAETRMQEDIQYLENVLNALMESSNTLPTSPVGRPTAPAVTINNSISKSKIPMRSSTVQFQEGSNNGNMRMKSKDTNNAKPPSRFGVSKSVNSSSTHAGLQQQRARPKSTSRMRADVNSNIESSSASASSSRPRIVHSNRSQNRAAPVKAKVQVINATFRQPSAASARAIPVHSNQIRSGVTRSGGNTTGAANLSYLELAKLKQNPTNTSKREVGSYSKMRNNNLPEGACATVGNTRSRTPSRHETNRFNGKDRDPFYRYDDGTYPSQNASSKCSSNCSSNFPSSIPSTVPINVPDLNNYSEDIPSNDDHLESSRRAPPLFFPPLERQAPILPVPPLLINPFARLRKGRTNQGGSDDSTVASTPSSYDD